MRQDGPSQRRNGAVHRAGERILLTLWVGGLWAIGYIVAPALFANLQDRALAGTLAAVMFDIIAWIGLGCGAALLVINQVQYAQRRLNWRMWMLLAMVVLVVLGHFVLGPMMAELRQAGQAGSAAFGGLHGAASVLYLATSLLGLVLVIARPDGA
jgi:hypothetical protein